MKKLLMATDLSARSDRALARAVSLAREHNAELTIAHVVDGDLPASAADSQERAAQETIRKQLETVAAGNPPKVSIEVVFGKGYMDILDLAEQAAAELIIVGLHHEDAFKDLFRGTTVERIVRTSTVPVLLVNDQVSGPYRRVVVAVDFSIHSRRAVEFAIEFVPDGEFFLVHAYDIPFKGFLYSQQTQREVSKQRQVQFQKMAEEEMATFLANLEGKAPKLERVMQVGSVREVIHRQVNRLKPQLLVVGTHGRTGITHAFLGSVAEDLLRDPPCDVLTAKAL